MDLQLAGKLIAVGGATSGLGRAIAERLIQEGAVVIGIARNPTRLDELSQTHGDLFQAHAMDLTDTAAVRRLGEDLNDRNLYGFVFNVGGPPTGRIEELDMSAWDHAYAGTLRWKIQLTKALLPGLRRQARARLLYVESVSIKQPIDNLVLSNTFRTAIAGFVKTLSRELGACGITANILAPGYHATPRITQVLEKAAELQEKTLREVEQEFVAEVPVAKIGQPKDFASMAAFLLSAHADYLTGQTISVEGGLTRHITG